MVHPYEAPKGVLLASQALRTKNGSKKEWRRELTTQTRRSKRPSQPLLRRDRRKLSLSGCVFLFALSHACSLFLYSQCEPARKAALSIHLHFSLAHSKSMGSMVLLPCAEGSQKKPLIETKSSSTAWSFSSVNFSCIRTPFAPSAIYRCQSVRFPWTNARTFLVLHTGA